jgi:hypothetical protein
MASSALKAHLHTSRKIVNDSHTFLLWDFPDLCCDCCLQFTNCLRIVLIHIILEIPPQIKIWGFKSGECAMWQDKVCVIGVPDLNRKGKVSFIGASNLNR